MDFIVFYVLFFFSMVCPVFYRVFLLGYDRLSRLGYRCETGCYWPPRNKRTMTIGRSRFSILLSSTARTLFSYRVSRKKNDNEKPKSHFSLLTCCRYLSAGYLLPVTQFRAAISLASICSFTRFLNRISRQKQSTMDFLSFLC